MIRASDTAANTAIVPAGGQGGSGAAAAAASDAAPASRLKSLRPPKIAPRSKGSFVRQRPSLTDQLASIGAAADEVTQGLHANHAGLAGGAGVPPPLLCAAAKSFVVGRLECRVATPVRFYRDKCVYVFNHPFERKQITMEMWYRDMSGVRLSQRSLRYKVRVSLGGREGVSLGGKEGGREGGGPAGRVFEKECV